MRFPQLKKLKTTDLDKPFHFPGKETEALTLAPGHTATQWKRQNLETRRQIGAQALDNEGDGWAVPAQTFPGLLSWPASLRKAQIHCQLLCSRPPGP